MVGAGGIFTGTNPSYTTQELEHHLKVSRAKFVVSEPELLEPIAKAAAKMDIAQSQILIFDVHNQPMPKGYQSWRTLLEHGEEDWIRFDNEKLAKSTTITRLFSSGTTGLPKAVDHSHTNLIAQHTLVFEKYAKPFEVSARMVQSAPDLADMDPRNDICTHYLCSTPRQFQCFTFRPFGRVELHTLCDDTTSRGI